MHLSMSFIANGHVLDTVTLRHHAQLRVCVLSLAIEGCAVVSMEL